MVNEAKAGKILSDKKLADANGKVNTLHSLCNATFKASCWTKSCDNDINFICLLFITWLYVI